MNDQQTQQMMMNQAQHQMMNQQLPQQMMNQQLPQPMMNHQPPPLPDPSPQVLNLNQQPQPQPLPPQLMMLNRNYNNTNKSWPGKIGNFGSSKPRTGNPNWKGKKMMVSNDNKRRMMDNNNNKSGYNPPTLHELQSQNRQKMRKFYPNKKKYNNNNGNNNNNSVRFAPYAPRNTTSFIIRAKKAGGIASLVSPCPVTPAVLPTPIFSPSREVLGDMAKEEWGVDGYGSMKGLIRLRSGNDHEDDDDEGNGSSESDVEEHVEVERRLDHDLSRFEMIYPNYGGGGVGGDYNNVLENRVDDQDSHIAQLEEENLTLKERLFLMERELGDLRRRMQFLERRSDSQHQHQSGGGEDVNEEVVENESENESENGSDVREQHKEGNNNEDTHVQEIATVNKEDTVRKEFAEDGIPADRDECRHTDEQMVEDEQMVAEVKPDDLAKVVNEIELTNNNSVAEKQESKHEEMHVEKSVDEGE